MSRNRKKGNGKPTTLQLRSTVGLSGGKIDWYNYLNCAVERMADRGLYARVIAANTGLTVPQVYNRCKKLGVGLREYRRGRNAIAQGFIRQYSVRSATRPTQKKTVGEVTKMMGIETKDKKPIFA